MQGRQGQVAQHAIEGPHEGRRLGLLEVLGDGRHQELVQFARQGAGVAPEAPGPGRVESLAEGVDVAGEVGGGNRLSRGRAAPRGW